MVDLKLAKMDVITGRRFIDKYGRQMVVTNYGIYTLQAFLSYVAVFNGRIREAHRLYKLRLIADADDKYKKQQADNYKKLMKELKEAYAVYLYSESEKKRKNVSVNSDKEFAQLVLADIYENKYDKQAVAEAIVDNLKNERKLFVLHARAYYLDQTRRATDYSRIYQTSRLQSLYNHIGINAPIDLPESSHGDIGVVDYKPIVVNATKNEMYYLSRVLNSQTMSNESIGFIKNLLGETQFNALTSPITGEMHRRALPNPGSIDAPNYSWSFGGIEVQVEEMQSQNLLVDKETVDATIHFVNTNINEMLKVAKTAERLLADTERYPELLEKPIYVRLSKMFDLMGESIPSYDDTINNLINELNAYKFDYMEDINPYFDTTVSKDQVTFRLIKNYHLKGIIDNQSFANLLDTTTVMGMQNVQPDFSNPEVERYIAGLSPQAKMLFDHLYNLPEEHFNAMISDLEEEKDKIKGVEYEESKVSTPQYVEGVEAYVKEISNEELPEDDLQRDF